jgi:hypothetical protein
VFATLTNVEFGKRAASELGPRDGGQRVEISERRARDVGELE